jgi:WD40 repeat protein
MKTLNEHKIVVTSLYFSLDGSKLVSGSFDNSINIWTV